jgi:hypothetical protein
MPSIPVDVLREILEHVRKVHLPTLCRVNKIFCSYSQDLLYREIGYRDAATQTLAQSTDLLARRVCSFETTRSPPWLATALRNMSSLRRLNLWEIRDASILAGCTFKIESFSCDFPHSESLQQFLNNQPSITSVYLIGNDDPSPTFDERCLPNLTRVMAGPSWLGKLIPGRPVRHVTTCPHSNTDSTDLNFFTLSTTPIQILSIHDSMLYLNPVSLLVSIFPSLVRLLVDAYHVRWTVRVCLSNR